MPYEIEIYNEDKELYRFPAGTAPIKKVEQEKLFDNKPYKLRLLKDGREDNSAIFCINDVNIDPFKKNTFEGYYGWIKISASLPDNTKISTGYIYVTPKDEKVQSQIIKMIEYIVNQFLTTDLYEKYYVDGKNVNISFPEKKRNLIILYVESLETTYTSKENGGNYASDLIPEVTSLAKENLNFSHQEKLGGAYVVAGTGWTTGGLVAQSSGVPLCVPFQIHSFNDDRDFLPGAYALGDILEKEGYEQEFLIGSEAVFGGRKFYYDKHGHFQILT